MHEVFERHTIVRVQTWDIGGTVPALLKDALGLEWPKIIGATAQGCVDVICVGPADWLVVNSDSDAFLLLEKLSDSLRGSPFRFVDVSSALSRIRIEGPHARALISKSCSLDVHSDVFPPGRSARTRFSGLPVIVRCIEPDLLELIVSTSYREYILDWLADATLEFGDAHA